MNEFIEKLIGRLEERELLLAPHAFEMSMAGGCTIIDEMTFSAYRELGVVKEIVKELAEEYKDNVIINGQYCWQTCGATEHCKECNRLCNGSIDYYENYDCLLEE